MGIDGEGSLEQGVASGEEFVVVYPNRFLEFYYAANPEELGDEAGSQQASRPGDGDEVVEDAGDTAPHKKHPKVENPIFQHLIFERSRCKPTGPNRGEYTHTYRSPAHNTEMARSLGCTAGAASPRPPLASLQTPLSLPTVA